MSANANETGDPSRKGALASQTNPGHPIGTPEPDEIDGVFIERRRRRRFQKKQLIDRARRLLGDAPPPDPA